MKRLTLLATLTVAFCLSAQERTAPQTLLEPGDTFFGDFTQESGRWLALVRRGDHYEWKFAKVNVSPTEAPEGYSDEIQAWRISSDVPSKEVLFFAKGLDYLSSKKVVHLAATADPLVNGKPVQLQFGRRRYEVLVSTGEEGGLQRSRVRLRSGNREQVLISVGGDAIDLNWSLLWAGDLDGDQKLDLYMNLATHYALTEKVLFLSSRARGSEIVGRAGSFATNCGC